LVLEFAVQVSSTPHRLAKQTPRFPARAAAQLSEPFWQAEFPLAWGCSDWRSRPLRQDGVPDPAYRPQQAS